MEEAKKKYGNPVPFVREGYLHSFCGEYAGEYAGEWSTVLPDIT